MNTCIGCPRIEILHQVFSSFWMSFSKFWQSLMKWLLALLMILLDSSHGKQPKSNIFYRGSDIRKPIFSVKCHFETSYALILGIWYQNDDRGDVSWWHFTVQLDIKRKLKRYLRLHWGHWKMRGRQRIGIFEWKRFYDNCDFRSVKIISEVTQFDFDFYGNIGGQD